MSEAEVVEKEKPVPEEEKKVVPQALVGLDAKLIKSIVSAVAPLVDEATIKLSPKDGFVLSAFDPSKIALVQVILPKDMFSKFDVENVGFYTINFKELKDVLRRIRGESDVDLKFNSDSIEVRSTADYKKTFKLPLLAGEPFEIKTPRVKFTAGVRMKSKVLAEIVSDLRPMADFNVDIVIDSKAVFKVNSEKGEAEAILSTDDPEVIGIWGNGESSYSIDYLEKISKPGRLTEEVKLEIATKKPMKVTYILGPEAEIVYYLAPVNVE
jgi:proliferating cell nuclear antigen